MLLKVVKAEFEEKWNVTRVIKVNDKGQVQGQAVKAELEVKRKVIMVIKVYDRVNFKVRLSRLELEEKWRVTRVIKASCNFQQVVKAELKGNLNVTRVIGLNDKVKLKVWSSRPSWKRTRIWTCLSRLKNSRSVIKA